MGSAEVEARPPHASGGFTMKMQRSGASSAQHRILPWCLGTGLITALGGTSAFAQQPEILYSIDYRGATIARMASGSTLLIRESDVLTPAPGAPAFGPLGAPGLFVNGGQLGLVNYTSCTNPQPGVPCQIEVDAISRGQDSRFTNIPGNLQARVYFSVDENATGATGSFSDPSVQSEALLNEAAADVFTTQLLPMPPIGPGTPARNIGVFDGNGLPASGQNTQFPGLGLLEPNLPLNFQDGDNLDALDLRVPAAGPVTIYFSLDAAFFDPLLGIQNSGSAGVQSVRPGAVLRTVIGSGPVVYAPVPLLGLDLEGPGTDDLDALAVWDNGDGIFQPSLVPYDWLGSAPRDMVLYSVRRGSQVVGELDSIFGVRIVPGDILTTPLNGVGRPGIFIAAEALGLRANRSTPTTAQLSDDADAIALDREPLADCNSNGVEDAVDIANGASSDLNENGIPDECEQRFSSYCTCPAASAPCGNGAPTTGCLNSTGQGAGLTATGTTSFVADDLVLLTSGMPPNVALLHFMGTGQTQAPFGDGLRCVGGTVFRFGTQNASPTGTSTRGPGLIDWSCMNLPPTGCIAAGDVWNFQAWYRNAANFCTPSTFNLSNGLNVEFTP
jgi:hypothetical protein